MRRQDPQIAPSAIAETMINNGYSAVTAEAETLNCKGSHGSPSVRESDVLQPRLLSYEAASSYLSLSYWTVRHMVVEGYIPHIKSGKRVLIDVQDLDEWIEKSKEVGV